MAEPSPSTANVQALHLMLSFAERTGVSSARPPQRYLWTDAFAVCNLLGLGRVDLALALIDQVHRTLAPAPDPDHPTRAGLRIGKQLPERRPDEPFDERLEWERDGQYFHYLTRWMHALDQASRRTGEPKFNLWARELAEVGHRAFTRGKRMVWKMSIDLSRPLVASMGHHDPLDGYVTCMQLQTTMQSLPGAMGGPRLTEQAAAFAAMIPARLATADPLGLGGLLADAWRGAQLERAGALPEGDLVDRLLEAALDGLSDYRRGELDLPAAHRLAFRELGLAIGLAAVPWLLGGAHHAGAARLARFAPLGDEIRSFWLRAEHRRTAAWNQHRDINEVMLATSLAPSGYLR